MALASNPYNPNTAPATAAQQSTFTGIINNGAYGEAVDYARGLGYSDSQIAAFTGDTKVKDVAGNIISTATAEDFLNGYQPGVPAKATKGPAQASQATQTSWDVTPNQTVKQQAYDIIKDDSLLMQQARSDSNQQMNARGLINSSMAAGAGQKAVLDSAVNIGKQDANTYASSAQANANSANQLSMFNAGESNKLLAASQAQSNLVSNAKLENDFKVQAASDAGFQKQYEMYVDALYKIDQNKDLDAPAKMAMKAQQAQALKSYSTVKGLGLDLTFLDPAPAATNPDVNSSSATETNEAKQEKIAKYEADLQAWTEGNEWARIGNQAPVNPYPYVAPKYA
jgi:hypothetical protein